MDNSSPQKKIGSVISDSLKGAQSDAPVENSLATVDIIKLLGLEKSTDKTKAKILDQANDTVLKIFFANILSNVIDKEDLDKFLAEEITPAEMDDLFVGFMQKYPKLIESLVKTVDEYKKILITKRVQRFETDKTFTQDEAKKAKDVCDQKDWLKAYELVISKY